MPVRILLADDHSVVRRGLKGLLESKKGWKVCAEASDGRAAVAEAKRHKPDVAILDIGMPELNGVEAARQIRAASPLTEVLILSAHGSEKLAREIFDAGGRGYLVKEDADQDLLAAVDTVRQHRPYFTRKLSDWVARQMQESDCKAPRGRLTPREREIVQLLAEGKSNKEAATLLGISVKTIETHRANIMLKLNVHSITELVHYAIRNEMIHT
ncbi:MAG TPA: response regulator transcription factor [Candidatus Acidoferrales bacterium]|nr:response regulator transcription factor [Candidatus Acidoferrales bacterium]